jgi:hypothetical protein
VAGRSIARKPLGDVIVVHPGVGHRQLVVIGVEAEQRQVRMHHLDVDAVEVHVLENDLGIAFGHPAAGLAITRDRPPLEPRCMQPAEDSRPTLHEWLDLEVLLPHGPVPQVLREAGAEEVGGLQEVSVP